jgi:hypothetical protein
MDAGIGNNELQSHAANSTLFDSAPGGRIPAAEDTLGSFQMIPGA